MNISNFSEKQKKIYFMLVKIFESEDQLDLWLSLPNKLFRSKTPYDALISGNYDYFERFFESSNIE